MAYDKKILDEAWPEIERLMSRTWDANKPLQDKLDATVLQRLPEWENRNPDLGLHARVDAPPAWIEAYYKDARLVMMTSTPHETGEESLFTRYPRAAKSDFRAHFIDEATEEEVWEYASQVMKPYLTPFVISAEALATETAGEIILPYMQRISREIQADREAEVEALLWKGDEEDQGTTDSWFNSQYQSVDTTFGLSDLVDTFTRLKEQVPEPDPIYRYEIWWSWSLYDPLREDSEKTWVAAPTPSRYIAGEE